MLFAIGIPPIISVHHAHRHNLSFAEHLPQKTKIVETLTL